MREWLSCTVDRILALNPKSVLEIGCGTGMILARVAPHCDTYVGLDFSPTGLDNIRTMQRTLPDLDRVTLHECSAEQTAFLELQTFDTIIVNSVIQHFPDVDYLLRVLDQGAVRLTEPGGMLFLGDVLNLSLLETFHTSVQLFRASDSDSCGQFRQRIRQLLAHERDLCLAPQFFRAFKRERQPGDHSCTGSAQARTLAQSAHRFSLRRHSAGQRRGGTHSGVRLARLASQQVLNGERCFHAAQRGPGNAGDPQRPQCPPRR